MRQAVIVIHGRGEQRPMSTLRGFADGAIPVPARDGEARYRSKPDDVSKSFELRRYVVPSTRSRPVTDLYEFYWADKMTGTKLKDLFPLVPGGTRFNRMPRTRVISSRDAPRSPGVTAPPIVKRSALALDRAKMAL